MSLEESQRPESVPDNGTGRSAEASTAQTPETPAGEDVSQGSATESQSEAAHSAESPADKPSEEAEVSRPSAAENGTAAASHRLRLNPTIGREKAVPIPTLQTPPGEAPVVDETAPERSPQTQPATEPSAAAAGADVEKPADQTAEAEPSQTEPPAAEAPPAEESQTKEATASRVPAPPAVELPPRIDDLDAEMEAEIEAALAGTTRPPEPETAGEAAAAGPTTLRAVPVPDEDLLEEGAKLTGKIQSVHGDDVFLDLGFRSPGITSKRQFEAGKKPEVGQIIEVVVNRIDREEGLIQVNLPKGLRRVKGNWESLAAGQIVDCMVTKTNKGGLEVTVGALRGFMPASQVDLNFVSDLESYVGRKLRAQVVEVNSKKRNLVLSHRAYLQIERKEAEEELWKTLEVGRQFTGTVKTIKHFGAFVDIGGVDGFLHVGEMSWSRVKHPSELLQVGQQVEVQVISLDEEKKRIGLGMRQLIPNPWVTATANYPVGETVSGKVTKIADFGAFVQLEPGLEGMVHISELDYKRVKSVGDVLQVGQEIELKVLDVNPDRKRISLSLKALKEKPEELKREERSDEQRKPGGAKRKVPLKGGMGSTAGRGGLFGDPRDFK